MNGYGNGGTGTIALGGSANIQQPPTPTSGNAHGALQHARKVAELLQQEIAALEARLRPILQDEPPTTTGNAGTRPGSSSAFVGAISDTNTALETALARLQNIASRIDL
jgi:hypothetical protein